MKLRFEKSELLAGMKVHDGKETSREKKKLELKLCESF